MDKKRLARELRKIAAKLEALTAKKVDVDALTRGDKLVLVGPADGVWRTTTINCHYRRTHLYEGQVVTFLDTDSDGDLHVETADKYLCWVDPSWIRLVEKEDDEEEDDEEEDDEEDDEEEDDEEDDEDEDEDEDDDYEEFNRLDRAKRDKSLLEVGDWVVPRRPETPSARDQSPGWYPSMDELNGVPKKIIGKDSRDFAVKLENGSTKYLRYEWVEPYEFKVGDVFVPVRPDTKEKRAVFPEWVRGMDEVSGKERTVKAVDGWIYDGSWAYRRSWVMRVVPASAKPEEKPEEKSEEKPEEKRASGGFRIGEWLVIPRKPENLGSALTFVDGVARTNWHVHHDDLIGVPFKVGGFDIANDLWFTSENNVWRIWVRPEWVERYEFQVGDTIRVARPETDEEREKAPVWVACMDQLVGKALEVRGLTSGGFVRASGYSFRQEWIISVVPKTFVREEEEAKTATREPKEGDKFILVGPANGNWETATIGRSVCLSSHKGEEVTFVRADDDGDYVIHLPRGELRCVDPSWLAPIASEEKPDEKPEEKPVEGLQVGDWVVPHRPDDEDERDTSPGWVYGMNVFNGKPARIVHSGRYLDLQMGELRYSFKPEWVTPYKFKPGDVVIPHKKWASRRGETEPAWVASMDAFDGKEVKIDYLSSLDNVSCGGWLFSTRWVEPVVQSKSELKFGGWARLTLPEGASEENRRAFEYCRAHLGSDNILISSDVADDDTVRCSSRTNSFRVGTKFLTPCEGDE